MVTIVLFDFDYDGFEPIMVGKASQPVVIGIGRE
jgi:hypothetical protein